jgi:Tfp pilus assembly protein PilF
VAPATPAEPAQTPRTARRAGVGAAAAVRAERPRPSLAKEPVAGAGAGAISTTKPTPPARADEARPVAQRSASQQAYDDYQAGRLLDAARTWREILRTDPTQKDAWLGLAVTAHRQGLRDEALAGYRQVLRLDPQNGEAIAGIATLQSGVVDSRAESRLREAVTQQPGNAMLNSALARLLAQDGRWDESQPYWFAAHAAAPDQPVHAYNLAVALDRLRKPALAAQYYRKALALHKGGPAGFDEAVARTRMQALEEAARAATP